MRAQAANELRDRILTGRLQPGDRFDLDQLSAEFGISRTPIREALLELSYEGLVAITPRSGMAVIGITPDDAVDNFAVLAALAGKAAEMAAARITRDELAELRVLAEAIDGSDDVVTANRRFHRAVNQAARSPRLLTYLRQAVRVVPGNYFELFPEQAERSRHEHAALLDAMTKGDARAARTLMESHVLTAGEALGGWLATELRRNAAHAEGAGVTSQELWQLVADSRNGILATINRDGTPQLSNIYYLSDASAGIVRFSTTTVRTKGRNLLRDPRATLHVAGRDFFNFAVVTGAATLFVPRLVDDPAVDELFAIHSKLGAAIDRSGFGEEMLANNRMAVRLTVDRMYGQVLDR